MRLPSHTPPNVHRPVQYFDEDIQDYRTLHPDETDEPDDTDPWEPASWAMHAALAVGLAAGLVAWCIFAGWACATFFPG